MDTLTHALSGALLAKATAPRLPRADGPTLGQRLLACTVATAVVPDLDHVVSLVSPLSYLMHHRGISHSFVMLPLWAVLCGALWSWLHRRNLQLWRDYAGLFAMGIALHIVGDLITPFGTMIFAPLSDARHTLSTTFIIDLWLTGLLLAGLVAALVWRGSRAVAACACVLVVAYVFGQAALRDRAIDFGTSHARQMGLHAARVRALPSPLSPFNWLVVVQEPAQLHFAYISLWRDRPPPPPGDNAGFFARLGAPYRPPADAQWQARGLFGDTGGAAQALAEAAWQHADFAFFRWFAEFPMLLRVERRDGDDCAWFEDLRFTTPGRTGVPFRYGMCRDEQGRWQAHALQTDGRRAAVY